MYVVTAYKIWEKFEDFADAKLYFDCLKHSGRRYVELKKMTATDSYEYFKSIEIFVKK